MHVNDLLLLNGASFLEAAYSTILKRQADQNGLDHFMGRLALGERKEAILVALATSTEARGSRIDLVGLRTIIKRHSKAPWRRLVLFFSEIRDTRRQLARIEFMLSEQRHGLPSTAVPYPAFTAPKPVFTADDLNRTFISLQENLSDTAHDADLFLDNFKKTIRSSPLFFTIGQ